MAVRRGPPAPGAGGRAGPLSPDGSEASLSGPHEPEHVRPGDPGDGRATGPPGAGVRRELGRALLDLFRARAERGVRRGARTVPRGASPLRGGPRGSRVATGL